VAFKGAHPCTHPLLPGSSVPKTLMNSMDNQLATVQQLHNWRHLLLLRLPPACKASSTATWQLKYTPLQPAAKHRSRRAHCKKHLTCRLCRQPSCTTSPPTHGRSGLAYTAQSCLTSPNRSFRWEGVAACLAGPPSTHPASATSAVFLKPQPSHHSPADTARPAAAVPGTALSGRHLPTLTRIRST